MTSRHARTPSTALASLGLVALLAAITAACGGGEDGEAARLRAENEQLQRQLDRTAGTDSDAAATDTRTARDDADDDWAWADDTAGAGRSADRDPDPEPEPTRTVEPPPSRPAPRQTPPPPAKEPEPQPTNRLQSPAPEPRTEVRTASAGTVMELRLDQEISASRAQAGDRVTAALVADLLDPDGRVVLPAGTTLHGRVTEAQPPRKAKKKAVIAFAFDEARLADGTRVEVAAGRRLEGEGWKKKDGAVIGGSAAGGALLGQILGGDSEATAAGAVIGGAIGSGVVLSKKGDDVVLPADTNMELELETPVRVERPVL